MPRTTRAVFRSVEPHPETQRPLATPIASLPAQGLAVDVEHLSAGYDEMPVLVDVTLRVPAGQLVALFGPNGAGKSTLLRVLTGMMRPWSGQARLSGRSPRAARAAGRVAYMPQQEILDWEYPLRVRDVVMTGRMALIRATGGWRRLLPPRFVGAEHHEAVERTLEAVDLFHLADQHISVLSGGQRKRTLLARALAQEADLLLLDEPFAGVDAASERLIHDTLRRMRGEGRTVLMVSHDPDGARDICDRFVLLNREILADGPPEDVARALAPTGGARASGRTA